MQEENKRKKTVTLITITLIFLIFCLFFIWIIYFFTKKDNVVKDSFISNVYIDDNFSNNTNSYIYAMETDEENISSYKIIDYEGSEILNLSDPYFHFFNPYYYNNKINFTWYKYDQNNKINFYKISTIDDYNDYLNENLDPFAYYYSEPNCSINHEYYYNPYYNYIFLIDNENTTNGKETSDNGGLGLPSIQNIVEINCDTNESKIINFSELLNYDHDDWYYVDSQNNYYRTLMPTNDLFHFNSLDFDGQNIYANSRILGTIFSIKMLDDNGNFLEIPEINWIYGGNFSSYYYFYINDINENYPLIYDYDNKEYVSNPEYDAQKIYDYNKNNKGLQDKFINWEIKGNYYSSSNLKELEYAQNNYLEELFMGEHCVKLLNPYIEEVGSENFFSDPNFYDSNNLYFSMFDNHAEATNTALEIHEKSIDDYQTFNNSNSSYIKILEINPNQVISKTGLEPMTGRVILNHQTEQKSDIISSVLFFNENDKNYVAVDQGYAGDLKEEYQARFTIYQFDTIDPWKEDFNNFKIIYDVNFNSQFVYRSYPIWKNLNDVIIQWF